MKIYIFGNGNISFSDFKEFYEKPLSNFMEREDVEFLLCDFRGVDTLAMELLKTVSSNVSVFHVGEKPRYFPDKFKTKVKDWKINGGFENDEHRDKECIKRCTHFLAIDFNSDSNRKSGTQKNIEVCEELRKIRIVHERASS